MSTRDDISICIQFLRSPAIFNTQRGREIRKLSRTMRQLCFFHRVLPTDTSVPRYDTDYTIHQCRFYATRIRLNFPQTVIFACGSLLNVCVCDTKNIDGCFHFTSIFHSSKRQSYRENLQGKWKWHIIIRKIKNFIFLAERKINIWDGVTRYKTNIFL